MGRANSLFGACALAVLLASAPSLDAQETPVDTATFLADDRVVRMLAAALGAVIRQEGFPGAVRIELDQPGYRIDEREVWRRAPVEGRWPAGIMASVAEVAEAGGRTIEVCDPQCPPAMPGDVHYALGQPRLLDDGRHRIAVRASARYSSGSVHTGHEAMYQVLVETVEDNFRAQAGMEYEALYGRP